ncbi:bifunctional diaminohydroxyphosphoribosylaminopyrimidine deaminase/5-amino-6-(5-phosphoribosylamino)uracil reductase RibD [Xylanibacter oryzae]|uniref:bifunctional diaminohydroxyphosphoribosylaminopyrimidine deaminase/5-amino-6-(5-phosphoribosylamino)uracil reductase RibD n=1 Tax=Xylanibacter oryzae TaxID=185293 RepID=UPI0004B2F749|nr:bifunctional diaminohydroxyphosphoribosylaminopyrimidine deaminase/5-amino-6-(5-phosphoribosylamino)uracil reductase RibD [Xylanibacter oryzae]
MNQIIEDEKYMRRCLQLAANGKNNAKPNPMVGAVIVCDGRIIGEGYHVRCGEGHAEVNAFKSVKDEDGILLTKSTMYVSLEPCSHYGRTPPCADLIVSKKVRRVVVGCIDPFAKVQGRGIQKLRDAGIEVTVGVLENECLDLNKRFVTYNTHHRPYVILKWAQSANGFLDDNFKAASFSTLFTQMLVHKLRAESDAILVGRISDERDHPQLNVREWSGRNPRRIVLDRNHPFSPDVDFDSPVLPQLMQYLYDKGIQSLLVEGGAYTHNTFIESGMWDEIRVEKSKVTISKGTKSASIPDDVILMDEKEYDGNTISIYHKNTY